MKLTANLLSYLLHPLLMPTLFYTYLFFGTGNMIVQFNLTTRVVQLAFIFGCTFVIPIASSGYLVATKVIKNLKMESREERFFPFLMTSIIYLATCVIFYTKFNNPYFSYIIYTMAIMSFNVVIATIITYFWKISIHSIGIGGLTGLIIVTSFFHLHHFQLWLIILLFILSGALMSARLFLGSHKPTEVYAGYLLGIACGFTGGLLISINLLGS